MNLSPLCSQKLNTFGPTKYTETISFGGCAHQKIEFVRVVYMYSVIYPIHGDKKVDGAIAIVMVFWSQTEIQ